MKNKKKPKPQPRTFELPVVREVKAQAKPCPFCSNDGSTGEGNPLYLSGDADGGPYAVNCSDCRASGPEADNQGEAIDLWNERVKR